MYKKSPVNKYNSFVKHYSFSVKRHFQRSRKGIIFHMSCKFKNIVENTHVQITLCRLILKFKLALMSISPENHITLGISFTIVHKSTGPIVELFSFQTKSNVN